MSFLPPRVAEGWTWKGDQPNASTYLLIEPSHVGDTLLEVDLYVDNDGPSIALTPAKAREIAGALLRRADLVEEMSAVKALEGERS